MTSRSGQADVGRDGRCRGSASRGVCMGDRILAPRGGDGPLVNGRPCGGPLAPSSPELDFPIETDFEFGAGVREAVLPLARTSQWSITVRECTDRGCSASSRAGSCRPRRA